MFSWLKDWVQRATQRHIEALEGERARLETELRAARAEWRALHGDKPVPMTRRQRKRLLKLRNRIDPMRLKEMGLEEDIT